MKIKLITTGYDFNPKVQVAIDKRVKSERKKRKQADEPERTG